MCPTSRSRLVRDHDWVDLTSADIFAGKTVIVFSLPGAFTPTCSSSHVPRFNQLAPAFKALGVDDIVCVSVNDAFVMNEWQSEQNAHRLTFLPDGNGEFTDKMGLLTGKEDLGFGKRSWRYSMLVRDGVIEKMFIEEEIPGDPYSVFRCRYDVRLSRAEQRQAARRDGVLTPRLYVLRAGQGPAERARH